MEAGEGSFRQRKEHRARRHGGFRVEGDLGNCKRILKGCRRRWQEMRLKS